MSMFGTGPGAGATVTTPAEREGTQTPVQQGPSTGAPPAGSPTNPGQQTVEPAALIAELEAAFPWLGQFGLSVEWLRDTAVDVAGNPDLFIQKLRQTPQYKTRLPGIYRSDGSMRMSEGEYFRMEDEFRSLMRQYGIVEPSQRLNPQDLVGLFESEQDPEEFRQRLQVYQAVRDAGDPIRDAFYVYSGIDLSVDDLFEAIVDENVGRSLQAEYVYKTQNGIDYETFLNRTTEVAMNRLKSETGYLPGAEFNKPTPEWTRQVMDVLYSNAGDTDDVLALEELLSAFEAALLGSEAIAAGLELPDKDRIQAFRAAGVQRSQAKEAYRQYALRGNVLSADAQRAGFEAITQERFEDAAFLNDTAAARALETAVAYAEAVGQSGGGFRFSVGQDDRFRQSGLR